MNALTSSEDHLLSIDELDRSIVSLSFLMNSCCYELLLLIREFDERLGWLKWGLSSCAEWLHWRCDLSMSAAREKVRVAHALKTLPAVTLAFSKGELSYSKVRALSRVARTDNEEELLAFALKTTAIKRALQARDKGCVFPGCHHTRFVDAHHVIHWSAGGETSLENLILLCSRHHRLVHEGGFRIERDFQNKWFFKRPDGRVVPNCGYQAQDMIDDELGNDISDSIGNTIRKLSKVINYPSAEGLLSAVKTSSVNSPPP